MQVGDLVRSKYTGVAAHARIGIIIQLQAGARLAQVFWPHRRDTGWVDSKDMEVINASR